MLWDEQHLLSAVCEHLKRLEANLSEEDAFKGLDALDERAGACVDVGCRRRGWSKGENRGGLVAAAGAQRHAAGRVDRERAELVRAADTARQHRERNAESLQQRRRPVEHRGCSRRGADVVGQQPAALAGGRGRKTSAASAARRLRRSA